jgi:plasmid stability protein
LAQVVIRNLDDVVVERLRARAAAERKSLEQKLREVLADAARPLPADVLAELARCRAMSPPVPAGAPLAEDIVREIRDTQ